MISCGDIVRLMTNIYCPGNRPRVTAEEKMEILGIDIGFGFTKAFNGSQTPMFKSIFGEAVDIQFHSNFKSSPMFSNLHVTIDNRSYFVGDYAEKQSNVRQFTLDQERLITDFVKIMALTAAGGSSSERDISINVVSGLPVAYFKEHHKRFSKLLTGQHKIIYHQPEGTEVHKQIYIEKVRMMPQPLGSFFDVLLDEDGQIVNEVITGQKVGIIDIGFQTTDYTVFDNLRYIDRGSTTMETGISKFFRVIAGKLQEKSGINVEPYRLYDAVENGIIKMRGPATLISAEFAPEDSFLVRLPPSMLSGMKKGGMVNEGCSLGGDQGGTLKET